MGEDHIEVNKDVTGTGRVTITEAATLLGVHPNTVRGRVRAGVYDAEKVATEHGLMWMIDRASLVNSPLPRDIHTGSSQVVNLEPTTPTEVVQELLRPFVEDLGKVREELGAERVRREQAERERDGLRRELEALQERPQATETAPEPLSDTDDAPESTSKATEGMVIGADVGDGQVATQSPERRSWWRRFFGFD